MNWKTFKDELLANQEMHLQFQYDTDRWVDASYHITEIKQAPIVSVDCGGLMNKWTEIIVQLWEPAGERKLKPMKVSKAVEIINLVEKSLALDPEATVKIEFGNSQFDTRQLLPQSLTADGEDFIVDLHSEATQCKAINRGGSCGTTEEGEECCAPSSSEKPKIQLKNLTINQCEPGSGCC